MTKSTYKQAGVDLEAGEQAVSEIKTLVADTFDARVLTGIGGFGSCYQLPLDQYRQPVLVSSTDGVGTKLIVASMMNRHTSVGECLVNHCVNDILTTGARPLYFLDYIGTGKLQAPKFKAIVKGLARACKTNGCALIGGETAEMPGIYQNEDYDLVGTITGVVEKGHLIHNRVRQGDVLIGLAASGLHTNGYSLARQVLLKEHKIDDYIPEIGAVLGEELLKIHRSYLPALDPLLEDRDLHGISHITGGGIEGNTRRILPQHLTLRIDWNAWNWLPVFTYIQRLGRINAQEMRRVFNLGIGLILICASDRAAEFHRLLDRDKLHPQVIGEVIKK